MAAADLLHREAPEWRVRVVHRLGRTPLRLPWYQSCLLCRPRSGTAGPEPLRPSPG
ncbi:MAG: hypothetical protein K8G79_05165 [bacterium]|uniref:Uncharacterized protein n=1 Tax=Candidatus Methylomirabilis tolerans TaxID=3123416 RepID=A0AAJ1EI74_9BACT|nr:hypothetical protein [Candidatus Methylomirabilis sp.]